MRSNFCCFVSTSACNFLISFGNSFFLFSVRRSDWLAGRFSFSRRVQCMTEHFPALGWLVLFRSRGVFSV
jgi:hypothetical protein